jgi:LEA14-like dessication related protein
MKRGPPARPRSLRRFVPKLEAPQLSIAEVQILSSDLWEQHLKVRMHVQNPNDRALLIKALECTLEVQGQQFASGSLAASVVPPPGESELGMNVVRSVPFDQRGTFKLH